MTLRICTLSSLLLLALVPACGGGGTTSTPDSSTRDSGSTDVDSGSTDVDSGSTDVDSGSTDVDSGSTDVDSGSTDVDSGSTTGDAGMCPPQPTDLAAIGTPCPTGVCPAGYTCQPYSGIILAHSCAILCDPAGCPCPSGTGCEEVSDKGATWHECRFLPD